MNDCLSLRCPACDAKLRAARTLLGHICPCPRCKGRVLVRRPIPSDADIALVPDDFALPGQPDLGSAPVSAT